MRIQGELIRQKVSAPRWLGRLDLADIADVRPDKAETSLHSLPSVKLILVVGTRVAMFRLLQFNSISSANRGLRTMCSYRKILLLSLLSVALCGCANVWHDLQPHRIRRINSGPAPSWDPEFSQTSAPRSMQLVRRDNSAKLPVLTANSADVTVARGQSAE